MTTVPERPSTRLAHVPTALWVGLVLGIAGFALRVTTREIRVDSSGYSCTFHDYAGYLIAAGIGVCIVVAWSGQRTKRVALRLAPSLMIGFSVLLVALAVLHVMRGTGTILNGCDGHPLPDTP